MDSDDNEPRPRIEHIIGQDLSDVSIPELKTRITLLHAEIARLTADIEAKSALKTAAENIFKT